MVVKPNYYFFKKFGRPVFQPRFFFLIFGDFLMWYSLYCAFDTRVLHLKSAFALLFPAMKCAAASTYSVWLQKIKQTKYMIPKFPLLSIWLGKLADRIFIRVTEKFSLSLLQTHCCILNTSDHYPCTSSHRRLFELKVLFFSITFSAKVARIRLDRWKGSRDATKKEQVCGA